MPHVGRLLAVVALLAAAGGIARWRGRLADDVRALTLARDREAVMRVATEEVTARDRVRLALARARAVPFDSAPPHLALVLADGRLTLERGAVVLRTMRVVAQGPPGVRPLAAIGASGLRVGDESWPLDSADLAALRRTLAPGHVVYVH